MDYQPATTTCIPSGSQAFCHCSRVNIRSIFHLGVLKGGKRLVTSLEIKRNHWAVSNNHGSGFRNLSPKGKSRLGCPFSDPQLNASLVGEMGEEKKLNQLITSKKLAYHTTYCHVSCVCFVSEHFGTGRLFSHVVDSEAFRSASSWFKHGFAAGQPESSEFVLGVAQSESGVPDPCEWESKRLCFDLNPQTTQKKN